MSKDDCIKCYDCTCILIVALHITLAFFLKKKKKKQKKEKEANRGKCFELQLLNHRKQPTEASVARQAHSKLVHLSIGKHAPWLKSNLLITGKVTI